MGTCLAYGYYGLFFDIWVSWALVLLQCIADTCLTSWYYGYSISAHIRRPFRPKQSFKKLITVLCNSNKKRTLNIVMFW